MALANATLVTGATISVTGGSTMTLAPSGKEVPEGIELIDVNAADYRTRTSVTCRSKTPAYNSGTQQYSKGRNFVTVIQPKILADLSTVFPTARIELDFHPEQTAAERLEMRKLLAQTLVDSDFETFWVTGSRA